MTSLLDIGRSAINAQREALSVTGQNIVNVNTEGYRRRDASLNEVFGVQSELTALTSQTGLGVQLGEVRRAFDAFVTESKRTAMGRFEGSAAFVGRLEQLQNAILPNGGDLGVILTAFFDTLGQVAARPGDLAPRAAAIEMGHTVSNAFNTTAMLLDDLGAGALAEIETRMVEANLTLDALASLNGRLRSSNLGANPPNSLLDERDRLIDKLSLLVPLNVSIGERYDAELRLGDSEAGPLILSGEDSRILSLARNDQGGIVFRVGSGQIVSQLERGEIKGLVDAHGVIRRALSELDSLARNFSIEMNDQHAQGIDLEGQLGKELFATAAFSPMPAASNQGTAEASIRLVPGRADQLDGMVMTFEGRTNRWLLKDDAGNLLGSGRSRIEIDGAVIDIVGAAKHGDRIIFGRDAGDASRISFLLQRPEEIAAASTVSIFPDTTNLGSAVLNATRAVDRLVSVPPLSDLLANNLSPVAAQEFLRGGVVGSIPRGTQDFALASFATQATATVSARNGADIGQVTLTLDGTDYTFKLEPQRVGSTEWQSGAEIAKFLQMGVFKSSDTPSKTLSELGISVAGSESGLIFASDGSKELTGATAFDSSQPRLSLATSFTAAEAASEIRIFTREGRQIAGPPLQSQEVLQLITEENGFSAGAEYRADYNTVTSGTGYRGISITQSRTATEPLSGGLNTVSVSLGGQLQSSTFGTITADSAVNEMQAQTLTLAMVNTGSSRSLSLPPAVDAAFVAERANASFAAIGVTAKAMTAVRLELQETASGPVQFDLTGKNNTPLTVTANIDGGDMSSLVDAINRRTNDTGITAELSLSTGAVTLIQRDGFDIEFSAVNTQDVSLAVAALDQSFRPMRAPVSFDVPPDERLRISGTVEFISGGSFQLSSNVDSKTELSEPDPMLGGLVSRSFSNGGTEVALAYKADPMIDGPSVNVDGTRVHAPSGRFETVLNLGEDGPEFSANVRIAEGFEQDLLPQRIAEETARQMRAQAPVPTLVGAPISAEAFPKIGTQARFTLGGAEYTLERVDGGDPTQLTALDFKVTGPESGRIVPSIVRTDSDGVQNEDGGFYTLSLGVVGGQLSGQGPKPASDSAVAFGLDASNSTATLQGRAIDSTLANGDYKLNVVVNGTDATVTVRKDPDGLQVPEVTFAPLLEEANLKAAIKEDSSGNQVLVLEALKGAGPIYVVNSEAAASLGFKVGDVELSVEDGLLYARSTTGTAIDIKAGGASAAGSYIRLTDIPDEDLIVIMGDDGAKRLGAQYLLGPPLKEADRSPEFFRVEMVDKATGRVELFDSVSGASIATRFSNGLARFNISGQDIELSGFAETGDSFNLATGQRAPGDARNMDVLASLGQQRTGFKSFQDDFRAIAAGVGSRLEAARFTLLSNEAVRDAAVAAESELSGVNLDEEAAKLMSQQQAYQAAARILQTAREMFDTLIRIA
jgi:flagellar hook-associated protein 1 FlgK